VQPYELNQFVSSRQIRENTSALLEQSSTEMGFKAAAVLAPVSFFLGKMFSLTAALHLLTSNPGVLFICFNVDHRVLYTELSEEVINDGFQFYTTFFNAPPAIKVCAGASEPFQRCRLTAAFLRLRCMVWWRSV
jgi:hypothetical protein